MRNLIKNAIRSFKNNKLSLIGLIFLLFFGLGAFCTMSNTTANIKNEYSSISSEGKLHDFTAAELYEVGSAGYLPNTRGISYEYDPSRAEEEQYYNYKAYDIDEFITIEGLSTNSLYGGKEMGTKEGIYYLPIPTQEHYVGETGIQNYTRTYRITLDPKLSTGLYQFFASSKAKTSYTTFDFKVTNSYESEEVVPQAIKDLDALLAEWKDGSKPSEESIIKSASSNIFSLDYETFIKYVNETTQNIYSVMTVTDTPLVMHIKEKYANEVDYRFFKSLNVTATAGMFYKIIDSNPEDNIDKIVSFNDSNNRSGNKLYSTTDWTPYNSEIKITNIDGNAYEPGYKFEYTGLVIPKDFNEVALTTLYSYEDLKDFDSEERFAYAQIMQIRFKRMLAGHTTTSKLSSILKTLAGIDKDPKQYAHNFFNDENVTAAYETYFTKWYQNNAESITISSNGNVVFSWVETLGTPQTCTISNWTGRLSVVNPQHLAAVSKTVLDPKMLNDFGPFKLWYKLTYQRDCGGEINADEAKAWFNSLTTDQFNFWIDPSTFSETSMLYDNIPGGATVTVDKTSKNDTNENQKWSGIDKSNIIECGGYNQVIWGCGISPDFMYPVVDISRPTPNVKTESLVYCNDAGYNTIKLAFVNSPVEEYLLARFAPDVNGGRKNEIVSEINEWAKKAMIFPDNIKSAYFANDTDNVLNCSGFRVAYIPNLVHTIDIVAIILCSCIGLLALIICFVIIKRYVERNRINIGIMRANGISKVKIALSLFPFALVPALIGGIAAYFIGLFLQAPTLNLFKNYWTLPTKLIGFDWVSMVVCVIAPFLLFTLISFVATMVVLRTKSVELMKAGSEFKTNSFSRVVKKPFKHFGIMTRFRVSLAFNSFSRLLMMAVMSCLTMSSLVFAFTTFDKLNKSRSINSSQFDYNFSLKLTTPTASGSTYSTYDYSQFGATNPDQYVYNINWNTAEPGAVDYNDRSYPELTRWYSHVSKSQAEVIGKNGNIMMPSADDMTGQNIDLMYLADKVSSRFTLDYNLGASFIGATSNPWEIALALMPSNSRNLAADGFNKIINIIGKNVFDANKIFEEKYPMPAEGYREDKEKADAAAAEAGKWCYIDNQGGLWHDDYYNALPQYFSYDKTSDTYSLTKHDWLTGFSVPFTYLIKTAYTDQEIVRTEYPIQYRSIPINWDYNQPVKRDELYTYIEAHIGSLSNNEPVDSSHTITIEGICDSSNFIYLTNDKGQEINSLLFSENESNDSYHPLIVNSYAAHKYNLQVGSILNIVATNTVDRYEQKIHPERFNEDTNKASFKVVGISSGTNGEAFYTTQKIANDILGLPNGFQWNKTHRYMRWQSSDSYENEEAPELIDLAGIRPDNDTKVVPDSRHVTKYTFTNDGSELSKPSVDVTSISKKNYSVPVGFNGIYTANKTGKPLTNGVTLYSYTGMYPGTSVYKTNGSVNKFAEILAEGSNLGIANLMSCIEDPVYYKACNDYNNPESTMTKEEYIEKYINPFIDKLASIYGDTTMITAICGAMDVAASDLIYTNLIQTFDIAETSIMAIVIPITIIIVGIISNLIIIDSKKMAAMLKALGYSDGKNLMSILAMFVPTIVFGLLMAIPLSYGLTIGYQSLIFTSANILVDVTQKWWYYVAAMGGIAIILVVTYAIGYAAMKRSRLVDEIK